MAQRTPRVGFLESFDETEQRRAKRAVVAGDLLAEIAAGLRALYALSEQQLQVSRDIAAMLQRAEQREQSRESYPRQ